MASSHIDYRTPEATWSSWTTKKAVSDGYKVSGWVYRAVSMIAKHTSSIPWIVEDANGTPISGHPVALLLENPNPEFSRQGFFELMVSWQQLSGLAYAKKVVVGDRVTELWPISPDRLSPIASQSTSRMIDGYEELDQKGVQKKSSEFTSDNTIAFRYTDPSDPIRGIGPLQVAAKAVDVDIEQLNWNKSAMQNRGILDGVFTFDKTLDATAYDTIKQKVKELFGGGSKGGNARDIGVIGSNAKYQRLSLTPAEMDFIVSRRFNREEIFIIFGVPPQLAGVQDAATYNNYATSMRIFWELTLIPILDDLKDSLNFHFSDELDSGLSINFDVSGVPSLKQNHREKAEISRIYHNMGVPVKSLNEMFTLGVPEYEGWDLSSLIVNAGNNDDNGNNPTASSLDGSNAEKAQDSGNSQSRSANVTINETAMEIVELFAAAEKEIGNAINNSSQTRSSAIQKSMRGTKMELLNVAEGVDTTSEHRTAVIDSFINSTMVTLAQVMTDSEREKKTATQIRKSIEDLGIFSTRRSMDLANEMHDSPL